MIRLKKLEIRNLLSLETATIDFDEDMGESGLVLICGKTEPASLPSWTRSVSRSTAGRLDWSGQGARRGMGPIMSTKIGTSLS